MCGLVGYIGSRNATEVLIEGLSKLEYRGYDSAGVALAIGPDIKVVKAKGRLAVLKKKLEKQGILVVMTREGEDDLSDPGAVNAKVQDLQRRVQLIHEKKPDCVISIHQNSYPDAAVKGAQVFYYTDSKEGEKLALCMQAALVAGLDPANHRKAKGNKTYYMLKKTDAVLVICECGFLSNPEEEALLNTKEYQKKVADALCDGVLTYLGEKKNGKEKTQTKTEETAAGAASAYACPAGGLSGIRRI